MKYSRNTPQETIDRFVGMYVNDLTVDMGKRGKDGMMHLYEAAKHAGLIKDGKAIKFVPK